MIKGFKVIAADSSAAEQAAQQSRIERQSSRKLQQLEAAQAAAGWKAVAKHWRDCLDVVQQDNAGLAEQVGRLAASYQATHNNVTWH